MNSAPRAGAALTALFGLGLLAQDPARSQVTVETRLAAAAMAEGRGDFAAAETELRAAIGAALPREKVRAEAALKDFLQRTGRVEAGTDPVGGVESKIASDSAPVQDPVRRLVERLGQGGLDHPDVKRASSELRSLGALAVGPLVETLPRAEGFLLLHTITLLRSYDDPRIAPALLQRLEGKDPAITAAIASRVDELMPAVRRPVAERLAAADQPPSVRADATVALLKSEAVPPGTEAALRELAKVPAAQQALCTAARDRSDPWVVDLAAALLGSEEPWKRGDGLLLKCRLEPSTTEAAALEVLEALSADAKAHFADRLVPTHPEWVRVAALGLAAAHGNSQDAYMRVQWWRSPDFAAKSLLAHQNRGPKQGGQYPAPFGDQQVEQLVRSWVEAGWRADEDAEQELADYCARLGRWGLFVSCLRDEDRAIHWRERLGASGRSIAFEVAADHRPAWHRLIVNELAASSDPDADAFRLVANWSWSGIDEATKQQLVDVVARWSKDMPVARRARGNGQLVMTPRGQVLGSTWLSSLVGVEPWAREVPVEVVLLLARAGHEPAFEALAKYDKALFLRECETRLDEENSRWIADYVVSHGTVQQRPLLLRCLSFADFDRWRGVESEARALGRLSTWADGSPDVVALGTANASRDAVATATVEASKVSVDDLERLLPLLPALHAEVANEAKRVLRTQLRAAHGGALHAALAALLASEASWPSEPALEETKVFLVDSLVAIDRAESKDLFERVLDVTSGNTASRVAAAKGLLAFAGDQRGAQLRRLLRDDAPGVVAVVFAAPEQRTDPALRDATFATVVRLGPVLGSEADAWFAAMDSKDAAAIAAALIAHESFPKMSRPVVASALSALSATKDGTHVTVILRAASHPDAGVRVAVATNLGRTFDRAAVPHLVQMLKDDENSVVLSANAALQRLYEFFEAQKQWESQIK